MQRGCRQEMDAKWALEETGFISLLNMEYTAKHKVDS